MVFREASVGDPEFATTGLGVINVIVTIFAVRYMDSAGRKTLLQYSWMGMCTSYVMLTMSFIAKPYVAYMDQASLSFLIVNPSNISHCTFSVAIFTIRNA